jgi:hypothetical protein
MLRKVAVRRASIALLVAGLIGIAVVSVSAARSATRQDRFQVITRTDHHAIRRRTFDCAAANARLCTRVLPLLVSYARPQSERCLQVWGGRASAWITGEAQGESVNVHLSRANSCEIHRWDALASLLSAR